MKRSHLFDAFVASPWYLHGPIYDRLENVLHAHLMGTKGQLPVVALDDDDTTASAPATDESEMDQLLPGGVALIDVRGVLAMHADEVNGSCMPRGRSYEVIRRQLDFAVADPGVRIIVMRFETPGGMAVGCQETFDAIRAADEVKPVYAFKTGYCFSAGEYLAAGCRSITAESPMTWVGSIGTIGSAWDTSAAADLAGYKRVVFRAGAYKALIQDGEPISDTAKAEEQRTVDAFGAAFHDAVRAGRGLDDSQAEAVLNGRTFMAKEAIALGLVDQVLTFPDFLAGITGTEPAMFGMKKPAPAPAVAPLTPPAAAGTAQESSMDANTQAALAALSDSHPTHANALVKAAMKPGANALDLHALVSGLENKALSDQLTALRGQLDAANAKATGDAASHATALAAKDAEITRLQALAKLAGGAPRDPGGDPAGNTTGKRTIPLSQQSTMTAQDHADVRSGMACYVDDISKKPTPPNASAN